MQWLMRATGLGMVKELTQTSRNCRACIAPHIVSVFTARVALPAATAASLWHIHALGNADLTFAAVAYLWGSTLKLWDHNTLAAVLGGLSRRVPLRAMWAALACLAGYSPAALEAPSEGEACGAGARASAPADRCGQPARRAAVLAFSRALRASRLATSAAVRPLLAHVEAPVREAASRTLEELERDRSVLISTLASDLEHEDERVARAALHALRHLAEESDACKLFALVVGLQRGDSGPGEPATHAWVGIDGKELSAICDGGEDSRGTGHRGLRAIPCSARPMAESSPPSANLGDLCIVAEGRKGSGGRAVRPTCTCLICDQQRASLLRAGMAVEWAVSR